MSDDLRTLIDSKHPMSEKMGILYLVATPIGNLEDITLRALRVLKEADLVACEDTRHTSKLLTHYGISTPRKSYHEFNEESRSLQLIQMLRDGKNIALVSDAGTPLVSDPGYKLVASCRREGIPVIPVPGPSAMITALIASGMPSDNFHFAGFLPPRSAQRKRRLKELADIPATLILYESPHRLPDSLEDMISVLGDRQAVLARELTKIHEEFLNGALSEIKDILLARPEIRGEITLIIEKGDSPDSPVSVYPESILEHLQEEMKKTGLSRNEALKSVARQRGLTRKQTYQLTIEED